MLTPKQRIEIAAMHRNDVGIRNMVLWLKYKDMHEFKDMHADIADVKIYVTHLKDQIELGQTVSAAGAEVLWIGDALLPGAIDSLYIENEDDDD